MFRAFLERRTPRGSSLGAPMSLHLVSPRAYEPCVRAFARLGVGPYRFPIRERYLDTRSCLPVWLQRTLMQFDRLIDKLITFPATAALPRSSKENRHMSALLPEPGPVMTW